MTDSIPGRSRAHRVGILASALLWRAWVPSPAMGTEEAAAGATTTWWGALALAALGLLALAALTLGLTYGRRAARLAADLLQRQAELRQLSAALDQAREDLAEARRIAGLGSWHWDPQRQRLSWSDEAASLLHCPPGAGPESLGDLLLLVHPEDRDPLASAFRRFLDGPEGLECEYRVVLPDGEVRHLQQRADAGQASLGLARLSGILRDVTETRRAALQQETRDRILTLMVGGAPLSDVLDAIAASIEAIDQSLLCSIMLLDTETHRLRVGSAPRLPSTLMSAMDGQSSGPLGTGSAHPMGERLLVADLHYHPYWQAFSGAAESAGVRACLSEPIRDSLGGVVGAFDVYSRVPGKPDESQLAHIGQAAALVAMALQHERDRSVRQATEERARLLLESANEGIFGLDLDGVITFINPMGAHMLGYEPAELVGRCNHASIHHSTPEGTPIATDECRMLAVMRTGNDVQVSDEVLWRRDGTSFPVEYRATPIRSHGPIIGAVVVFHDITDRKRWEQHVHRLAYYDWLTGLPNRRLFKTRLGKRVENQRRQQEGFALHLLDLDRFKEVNDTLGHPMGDALLREVGQRLQSLVRITDTVARFGGDEFAVIQPDVRELADAAALAEKVVKGLAEPYRVDGHEIQCGTSVGVVFTADEAVDAETLLSRADVALYKAKSSGRGRYAFHTDEMTRQVRRDAALTDRLDRAVGDGELFLLYQPQVEIDSRRIVAVEALVRWCHPAEGILPPGDFVHLAERRGLFQVLGGWVFATAAAKARDWQDRGLAFGRITVNVSPQQMRSGSLAAQVTGAAREAGIDPALLELELTETALLEYGERYRTEVAVLREAGIRLTVDDFGTGFSSLTYLRRGALNALKIDRQLVRELNGDKDAKEIVSAVLALARTLGLDTIAEGVETEAQARALVSLGCRCAQGLLFAPPMDPIAIETYLAAGRVMAPLPSTEKRAATALGR
jgi:diguanylate cyclase (GGDEF)-like protein/PAS domain S-box-containing protein